MTLNISVAFHGQRLGIAVVSPTVSPSKHHESEASALLPSMAERFDRSCLKTDSGQDDLAAAKYYADLIGELEALVKRYKTQAGI